MPISQQPHKGQGHCGLSQMLWQLWCYPTAKGERNAHRALRFTGPCLQSRQMPGSSRVEGPAKLKSIPHSLYIRFWVVQYLPNIANTGADLYPQLPWPGLFLTFLLASASLFQLHLSRWDPEHRAGLTGFLLSQSQPKLSNKAAGHAKTPRGTKNKGCGDRVGRGWGRVRWGWRWEELSCRGQDFH